MGKTIVTLPRLIRETLTLVRRIYGGQVDAATIGRAIREGVLPDVPGAVPVAGFAIAVTQQLIVHELTAGACQEIDATDLHSLPEEPPRLLRRICLIEARDPEGGGRLFGDVASIGVIAKDGTYYLLATTSQRIYGTHWHPKWGGDDIEADAGSLLELSVDEPTDDYLALSRQAVRFVLTLGILLDAEGTPLGFSDEGRRPKGPLRSRSKRKAKKGQGWTVRHVYLSRPPRPAPPSSSSTVTVAPPAGMLAEVVEVRGHLKRQHYGAGRAQVKWVYVAGYSARRWLAPGPRKIVVHE